MRKQGESHSMSDKLNSMKLIFIYGVPASGKLTIAEKLSELTSIPLFHNHLSRDIVKDIYAEKLMSHYDLVDSIRTEVLTYCAKNNTDLIFTYVYGGNEDDEKVRHYISCIEDNGGKVQFVELLANKKDLINRVDNESRKRFKKLTDRTVMQDIANDLIKYHMPFVDSIGINTSKFTPAESAKLIAEKISSN